MQTMSSFRLFYKPGLAQLELRYSTRPWQKAAADTPQSGHPALLTPIRTGCTLPHSSTLTPNQTLDACGTLHINALGTSCRASSCRSARPIH